MGCGRSAGAGVAGARGRVVRVCALSFDEVQQNVKSTSQKSYNANEEHHEEKPWTVVPVTRYHTVSVSRFFVTLYWW